MADQLRTTLVTTPEQYELALRIRRSVFIEEQGVPEDLEIDGHEKEALHFLCAKGPAPVGTGRLRKKGPFIKFERIATLREHRGSGVGASLMKAMEAHASGHFPHLLPVMHAQKDAVEFYRKLGWRAFGEEFVEAGIVHIFLCKPGAREELALWEDPGVSPELKEFLRKV